MYLTYLDDGGKGDVRVFGGIVLHHDKFGFLETNSALIAAEVLPQPEHREEFEFHATDLFAGTGSFEGVPEEKRHRMLLSLAQLPLMTGAAYVYSAIDHTKLQRGPMRSARWIDTAFFVCACGVENMLHADSMAEYERWKDAEASGARAAFAMDRMRPLNLMIVDEPEQGDKDRQKIRATFRGLRGVMTQALRPTNDEGTMFTYQHRLMRSVDDVFFGSSRDSIGLQIADVCNWIMWRRLLHGIQDRFYEVLMQGRVICAKPEPEWTENRHLFRAHDDDAWSGHQ